MFRYALVALPGPGDAVLNRTKAEGCPPEVVVHAGADDFAASGILRLPAERGWERTVATMGLEALVVANWERILPDELLASFPKGGWNLHPSLLPSWRGHNPYFHVLARGETETGVTVHQLTSEVDRGPILLQRRVSIDPEETLGSLWRKLGDLAAEAWIDAMPLVESGSPALTPQPAGADARLAAAVKPADLELHEGRSVDEALRLVRAANPFYGATAVVAGRRVRVFSAIRAGDTVLSSRPAYVLPRGPLVRCRDGYLCATVLDVDGVGVIAGELWSTYVSNEPG